MKKKKKKKKKKVERRKAWFRSSQVVDSCELQAKRVEDRKEKRITKGTWKSPGPEDLET